MTIMIPHRILRLTSHLVLLVSDIATFVLKRDVKHQLTTDSHLVVYKRRLIVALVEQIVAVVEQQDVSRVIDERVVGDAADGAQQRNYSHRVLGVPLEPVVAHLTTRRRPTTAGL